MFISCFFSEIQSLFPIEGNCIYRHPHSRIPPDDPQICRCLIPKQLILKAGQTTLTTPSLYVIGNQWELCRQIWSCESFALLRGLVWSLWDVYLSVSARVSRTMLVVGVCKYQKWVKACQIATKDMESEYVTNYWYRTGTVRAYSNLMVSSARIN